MRVIRLAYLASRPNRSSAPLLKRIAAEPDIALTAFFESAIATHGEVDGSVGRAREQNIAPLDGYRHRTLPALADAGKASIGFWRPLSFGLIRELLLGRFDALWVDGYAHALHLGMLSAARARGLRTLLRDKIWEQARHRQAVLSANQARLWPLVDLSVSAYLAIGSHNAVYYKSLGVDAAKIFPMPYAVDNAGIRRRIAQRAQRSAELRGAAGIGPGQLVFLQPTKLRADKRPALSVEAFAQLKREGLSDRAVLLLAGDGSERPTVEHTIAAEGLDNVRLLSFQDQAEMAALYGLADVCLLPSQWEPWGLAVNEAMNGGCAVIASDRVGAAADLVQHGVNGLVVPHDSQTALTAAIRRLATAPDETRRMGRASLAIIDGWSFEQDVTGLRQALKLAPR